jgi:hypothetical protein
MILPHHLDNMMTETENGKYETGWCEKLQENDHFLVSLEARLDFHLWLRLPQAVTISPCRASVEISYSYPGKLLTMLRRVRNSAVFVNESKLFV